MLSLLALLLLTTALAAADVPVLKARTGPPIVPEFLGGCSLTCSFPWSASDDAQAAAKLTALNDADLATAWTGARPGEKLTFKFPADLPRELNGTPFYGIDFANGRTQPEREFKDYGRVKTVRLYHNGKPVHTIELGDSRRWQHAEFDDIYLNVGDTLTLEILEVYPGRVTEDAALSEVVLQGAH